VTSLNICGGSAARALIIMLVNSKGAELLALVIREFIIAAVLMNNKSAKLLVIVFTGCVDIIGGLSCLVILLALYVEAALVNIVDARSLVVLSIGFLAVLSSVVFSVHVKGLLAIISVISAESLNIVFISCVNAIGGASCLAILLSLYVKAALVNIVSTGLLGARSLVVLGIGLLAILSLVIFLSATTGVINAESLNAVFTGCVNVIGEASCLVVLLALYVKAALVDIVGTGLLGARSLVALVTQSLAV
jgi:hypothetical protein